VRIRGGTGSELCPMVDFGITNVKPLDSTRN
jgi:hypothetical protein